MSDAIQESQPRKSCLQRKAALLLMLASFFALTFVLQKKSGAYQAEFGSEPDEAAHYVTGLCVRDYIAGGFRTDHNPLTYAEKFREHYPKVAIGHWPPVFYLIQSAWTIPFSPSRTSVLLLMAFLTALIATTLFSVLQKEFGDWEGVVGAGLFIVLPLTERFSGAIMTEIPIALFAFAATISFGRFLDNEKTCNAVWFGIFASLAILTKQSALALAFVPAFGILFSRKFYLLKRLSFWSSGIVVIVLCGPWLWFTRKLASEGWTDEGWGWAFTSKAVPFYPIKLYATLGAALTLLALLGFATKLFRRAQNNRNGLWMTAAGLLLGVICFHIIVPVGFEDRHLIPALAAVVLFVIAGLNWIVKQLSQRGISLRAASAVTLAIAVGGFVAETDHIQLKPKGYRGFGDVAQFLLNKPEAKKERFLVASDARGEGMFISETVMREKRPGHFIKRASKELASSSWSGGGYKPKFADEQSLANFLQTNSVRYVVFDDSLGKTMRKDYHDLLARTLEQNSFTLEKSFPIERGGKVMENGIRLYRVAESSK